MTKTKLSSPWHNLPKVPPYILPEDIERIRGHRNFSNLRLDTLPGQVIGGLNNAEVVFLALNPGFDERDRTINLKLPGYVEANSYNHSDPYSSPFYYFNAGFETTGGYEWWTRILKPLLNAGVTEATLRHKLMAIEYFPYHSIRYNHIKPFAPSQQFAFDLAREAIERSKLIVIMRSEKLWLEAEPELAAYPYMMTNSKLNVVISPNNLGEENFKAILSKLQL
jgi:hypothetical protein